METFSCKISDIENQSINLLANRWGCNRAEAARRAFRLAQSITDSATKLDSNNELLQEIINCQKRTIEMLMELAKFSPLLSRINRLEEYTVQACLSSGVLAKQAGLFEAAKNEYNAWRQNREAIK